MSQNNQTSSELTRSLGFGVSTATAPYHCGLNPKLVKLALVALAGLARIVRHKHETLSCVIQYIAYH